MNYTDTDGNPASGVVWSPGPVAGSVWVLPYSGAPTTEARVVSVWWKRELPNEHVSARRMAWNFDDRARESDTSKRLAPKDWHAALGFNPAERVQCFEGNDAPTLLDLTA